MKKPAVYIMADKPFGTLYTGVTSDILRRVPEHQSASGPNSFTARYGLKRLVYVERLATMPEAIAREKEIKGWPRNRKLKLVSGQNADWVDLSLTLDAIE